MDIALALEKLIPAAKYEGSVTKNTITSYKALRWNDGRVKPTWAAIQAADLTLPEYQTPEDIKADEVAAFSAASTANDKINLIAKKIGLK